MERDTKVNGGVTVPGRIENTCRCGTWGHSSVVGLAVLGK